MKKHHVHHLISTKLHCAPPKCTSVQTYIGNLDLYIHCEPPNDYTLRPCPCAPPEYVRCELTCKSAVMKNLGGDPYFSKSRPPLCTTQADGAPWRFMVYNVALYRWSGTQRKFHKRWTIPYMVRALWFVAMWYMKTTEKHSISRLCLARCCDIGCVRAWELRTPTSEFQVYQWFKFSQASDGVTLV